MTRRGILDRCGLAGLLALLALLCSSLMLLAAEQRAADPKDLPKFPPVASKLSLMPEGLEEGLTNQDLG